MKTYLCIGPNCWGKGPTPEAAIKEARKHKFPGRFCYYLFESNDPKIHVDDMGSYHWSPKADPDGPRLIQSTVKERRGTL